VIKKALKKNTRPVARLSNGNFFGNVSGGLDHEKTIFADESDDGYPCRL
jgi:hypothetical protein